MKRLRKKWGLVEMKGRAFLVEKRAHAKPCGGSLWDGRRSTKQPGGSAPVACVLSRSAVSGSFVTPWTAARPAPPPMGFPRQEYWSGVPFPPPGDFPNLGIKPMSPASPGRFFTTEPTLLLFQIIQDNFPLKSILTLITSAKSLFAMQC